MAAYDLNVQKPASLAIPNTPGAADLARFLSVSESTRANQEQESLRQNIFDWEKGAGGRELTKAENERERVRQENMATGRYSTESGKGYLENAKKGFSLEEDTLKQFDAMFPNATAEQREGLRQRTKEQITQNPNAFVNQKEMKFQLENQFVNERGWDRTKAASEAERIMAANFKAPAKMDDEIKKGFVDAIGESGITDSMIDYYTKDSKSGGTSPDFIKSMKFLQSNQLDYEGNKLRDGSRPWYSGNLPFSDHELYTDDMNKLSMAIQQDSGVNPMYTNAVILSAAENGKIPDGISPEDLMDKEGIYYASLKKDAEKLQRISEGKNSGGISGRGGISPEELRGMKQGDMEVRYQALNALNAALQGDGGKPLTSKEQFQIMSDPDLLREFDLVMQQTTNKNTGNSTNAAPRSNPASAPAPEASPNTPAATVDNIDDPDPIAAAMGEGQPVQKPKPAMADNLDMLPNNNSAQTLQQKIIENSRKEGRANFQKSAKEAQRTVEDTLGSDKLMSMGKNQRAAFLMTNGEYLKAMPDEVIQQMRDAFGDEAIGKYVELLPVPPRQEAVPTGNGLSLEEMAYEPGQSEISTQADESEQMDLNGALLQNQFPEQSLSGIKKLLPDGADKNRALSLFNILDSGRATDKQVKELMAMLSVPKR